MTQDGREGAVLVGSNWLREGGFTDIKVGIVHCERSLDLLRGKIL
jgi:hypothetical protein